MSTEEPIYFVKIVESSPNKIENTKRINERKIETTYKYHENIRRQISAIRARSKIPAYSLCLRFYDSMYVKGEKNKELILSAVLQADRDLRAIDQSLGAKVIFLKLDAKDVFQGEYYEEIVHAIKTQIYGTLIERMEKITQKGDLPDKTRDSLYKLCDKMDSVNILNDEEIAAKIESFRAMLKIGNIDPIMQEINNEIGKLDTIFPYIEEKPDPQVVQQIDKGEVQQADKGEVI